MRGNAEKLALFKSHFNGLPHVYGSYDPRSGRAFQVKEPVTDRVLLDHLTGRRPYGVYLLVQDRTSAIAVDFDEHNPELPLDFGTAAFHYGMSAYIERSKSKGHHVWIFFQEGGVLAAKARRVVTHILDELGHHGVEVFPKQDRLDTNTAYGNYINAPLFGRLVPKGKTVFVQPDLQLKPYDDQWQLLASIQRVPESALDEIVELNDLIPSTVFATPNRPATANDAIPAYGLPPCARRILAEGVDANQRVICFRLAIHCNRLGFPFDITVAALREWARKNHPADGKRVLTGKEIVEQADWAYRKDYRGFGCDEAAVKPFCSNECPINRN